MLTEVFICQHISEVYCPLDEVQNVAGWEKFARCLADSKYKVFITGSNAQMLSKEIYTTLGGRYIAMEIYPVSFVEYLQCNHYLLPRHWEYDTTVNTDLVCVNI